uniref:SH3 domain-containing protein n=1 Tax=Paramoeba aestuarina TaxID=180227 RepID=A0A7S4KG81_9EUKA|mmetsp:Transcript_18715/g.29346  ORF Transcript_18715/g.29346 Transcript_18715/m.29346 type:complete len:487 (+) Transcript_18715:213-1673(+)
MSRMLGSKKKKEKGSGSSSKDNVAKGAAPAPAVKLEGSTTSVAADGSKWTKVFLDSHSYKTVKVSPTDTVNDIITQIQTKLRAPISYGRFAIYRTTPEGEEIFCADEELFDNVLDQLQEDMRLIYILRKTQDINIFGNTRSGGSSYELGVRSSNRPTSCFVLGAINPALDDGKGKQKEETTWGRGEKRAKWKAESVSSAVGAEDDDDEGEKKGEKKGRKKKVNVIEDFTPEKDEQMAVKVGMVLEVLKDEAPEDFLMVQDPETEKKGLVPKSCVKAAKKLSSKKRQEPLHGTVRGRSPNKGRRMRQLRSQMHQRVPENTTQLNIYLDDEVKQVPVSDCITTLECIAMATPTGARTTYWLFVEEGGKKRKIEDQEKPLCIQQSWPSETHGKFILLPNAEAQKLMKEASKNKEKPNKNKTTFFPKAVVLYKFRGVTHQELDLDEGDHVYILESGAQGWVRVMTCPAGGRINGDIGLAPSSYLKRLEIT